MYGAMPYMQLQSFFLVKQPSPSPAPFYTLTGAQLLQLCVRYVKASSRSCAALYHTWLSWGTCELEARMLSLVAVVGSFNTRYFFSMTMIILFISKKIIFSTNKKFNASVMSQTRQVLWSMDGAVNL